MVIQVFFVMCLAHDIMDYTGVCLLELTDQIHRLLVCFKLFMNHKAIYDSYHETHGAEIF